MRLDKIKVSGFKSFVDPTTVSLPSNLVAVVGPNGCGKSNIIDAVTWVMGESSPKYLRGESLTDVIFNGSNARKPVGQASVELVFDNQEGSIGGEYAKFAEISVKRMINRSSDSAYYLNGVRCRKRDVVDIFLGTGLGPRSYSIIGQNMITRIIEAKPDDLRKYLEEAAGISKYKERRHETELRIKHTKENLERVNDVNTELEKQLNHLKHQATVAEKYKNLKQQERVLKAELFGAEWRELDSQMVDYTLQIQREETALEAKQSELSGTDREIEQMRHEQRVAQDAMQEVQRRYYAVGNEITRIEQDLLHHEERQNQWQHDLEQTEKDWQEVKDQLEESEESLRDLEHETQEIEPKLSAAEAETRAEQQSLSSKEESMQEWQRRWDEFNQASAQHSQTAQVEKTRIQHFEQRIEALQKRKEQLQQEQSRFNFTELNKELETVSKQSFEIADELEYKQEQLEDIKQEIHDLQTAQEDANNLLDSTRSDLQRLHGQQSSLEALQQTALGKRDNPATPWMDRHDLSQKPRLAQHMNVEAGWELAIEKVLGFDLQAICADNIKDIVPHLDDFKSGNVCIFSPEHQSGSSTPVSASSLLSKITAPWPLDAFLGGIYAAESMDEAISLCESLNDHESVVTRDGIWMTKTWLKVLRDEDPAQGVLQREQELKNLSTRIMQLEASKQELEEKISERREKISQLQQQREQLQQTYSQQQAQAAQLSTQKKMKAERITELKEQSERCILEQEECQTQLVSAQDELHGSRASWQGAMETLEHESDKREGLSREREEIREALLALRSEVEQKKELVHELQIRLQTAKSQKASLQQNIARMQAQHSTLHERKTGLQGELSSMPALESLKKTLSRSLDKHVTAEAELNMARVLAESLDQEYRQLEEKRQIIEREQNKHRSHLEKLRVESQGWKVKSETILEQMKETGFALEEILKDLPQDISVSEWQNKLEQTTQRISRLGAINLMAIEEYATCQERKLYLDKQVEDLQAGLNTLEDAIAKIDRETRNRFKDTFDKVNARFQELFPTIFGGGKAYLELNSDNLLEAGITMMACPPGKRNSSIHLLSGGEKSLTAIALIFSIFYLNPAPFCLLDEVDAALDDANVLRFTRLVKTMADKTQFIFISHNKITIEMGEHLIGVTMNEPGVSRLVSVDIAKAIDLASM